MKIGELDMHCGSCPLIDMCAEPYEFAICESRILRNITPDQYKEEFYKRHGTNEKIFNEIKLLFKDKAEDDETFW